MFSGAARPTSLAGSDRITRSAAIAPRFCSGALLIGPNRNADSAQCNAYSDFQSRVFLRVPRIIEFDPINEMFVRC
jgi:hypothetical protein